MKLNILVALLSFFYVHVDGCNSLSDVSSALSIPASFATILGTGIAFAAFSYPVDVYPSKCKRNHYQVCTMTEAKAIRENGQGKFEICRKGSRDCIMRCNPEPMDRDTVKEIKKFVKEKGAEFNVHRGNSGITEYCNEDYTYDDTYDDTYEYTYEYTYTYDK